MCGITGILSPHQAADDLEGVASAMTGTMEHRGPDADGLWMDAYGGVALGHRRLSILDLSENGAQPMTSTDDRYTIVHNGEIYNFRSLRSDLEAVGHRFNGTSDTEVILAAVTQWGLEGALSRFIGMFAFAIWDAETQRLHLARDRLGEKPMYYGWAGGTFLFTSELKALHQHPAFEADLDRTAMALYLRYGYVPDPHAIYQGISKLSPGHHLTVQPGDKAARPQPYWSAKTVAERGVANPLPGPEDRAIDRLEQALGDAVERCLVSDVPLGVFLSGGLDSSTITALAQARSSEPVRTFTIGFWEEGYDEAEHAGAVAEHLGTDHQETYVEPEDAMAVIPELPRIYDEPFADSSQIPTHLVSKMARQEVTVALSGDGGDELFAGYQRHFLEKRLFRHADRVPAVLRRGLSRVLQGPSPARWDQVARVTAPLLPGFANQGTFGNQVHKGAQLLEEDGPEDRFDALTTHWRDLPALVGTEAPGLRDLQPCANLPTVTERMMYLDTTTYLPGDILTKVDRASMATSLETRAPLLNHDVVELAWRLPLGLKVRDGQGKWALRQVLYRHVPQDLVDRPKTGFAVPIDRWLRNQLYDWASDLLDPRRLSGQGLLDPHLVQKAWDQHQAGRRNHPHRLWTILMLQAWIDEHHPEIVA